MTYEQIRETVDEIITALDEMGPAGDNEEAEKRTSIKTLLAAARLLLLDLE